MPRSELLDHRRGSRGWLARLILDLRAGRLTLNRDLLDGVEYEASTALALIHAQLHPFDNNARACLYGTVNESLSLRSEINGGLVIAATVHGDVNVRRSVAGNVHIPGTVSGNLDVSGPVPCSAFVSGTVNGDVTTTGTLGVLLLSSQSTLKGDLRVYSETEYLVAQGDVDGKLEVLGQVGAMLLTGSFGGRMILTPDRGDHPPSELRTVRGARFGDEVFVGDNVDISLCDFRQCPDLAKLDLVGADLFPPDRPGLLNPPPEADAPIPPHEMASIYRQLRSNLENRKNRAASGRFYLGEMECRRAAAKQRDGTSLEGFVLGAYNAISKYGLSPWRPIGWFLALALLGAISFGINGLDLDPVTEPSPSTDYGGYLLFSFRSMISFLSPPNADLSTADEWSQIGLRFSGPILLAQIALSVRERVAR